MKVKEKYIKQPGKPYEPTKPIEFLQTMKFVGHLLAEHEDRLELSEISRRIELAVKDRDKTKLTVVRQTHCGYYDEPDRNSIEIHEKVQQKNRFYKAELKAYEKRLKQFKLDDGEYKRLKKLFDVQEAKKDLRKLEIELEEIKSNKATRALEKQKAKALERLDKLSGEEDSVTAQD